MKNSTLNALRHSLTLAAAAVLVAACSSDAVVAPEPVVNLGNCTNLQAPTGTVQTAHVFARGMQIYRWDGGAWALMTPSAVLTVQPSASTYTLLPLASRQSKSPG